MMLDIDHFKKINDTYGHSAGDSVLIHVAELMNLKLRASDWVGRYGGEEFLVVAAESPAKDVIRVAERLRLAIANTPFCCGEQTIPSTISIGIANTCAIESPTPEMLVQIADAALYRAKKNGRNRIEVGPERQPVSLKLEDYEGSDRDSMAH
jgi:diguanylate cyclase (GGDEF)-like protein